MIVSRTIAVVGILLAINVAALAQPRMHDGPTDPRPMSAPEMMATPYTAEQIRDACPKGRTWVLRLTAPNGDVTYRRTTFIEVNDTSAIMTDQEVDANFAPIGESESGEATWEELRLHAQFPSSLTVVSSTELTTQLGTLACKVYRVQPTDRTKPARLFYFADDLPGPPIKLTVESDGGELIIFEMVHRGTI